MSVTVIRSGLIRRTADGEKFVGVQGRTADQSAVDIRHGKQLGSVVGLDAAAVEDL